MEHLLLKAATTATDEGIFEAVISTATVDRDKDIVEPSAVVSALAKWAQIGKRVPLLWHHGTDIVGHVDPATAHVRDGEVVAKGWVDQSTPKGEETWRLVKSGTLSFSFGFLVPGGGASKRRGGGLHIKELDVFEISVVPAGPANNDTRVLSFKSAEEQADPQEQQQSEIEELRARVKALEEKAEEAGKETKSRSVDPLRTQSRQIAQEVLRGGVEQPPNPVTEPEPEPEMNPVELRKHARDLMVQVLSGIEET